MNKKIGNIKIEKCKFYYRKDNFSNFSKLKFFKKVQTLIKCCYLIRFLPMKKTVNTLLVIQMTIILDHCI